MVTTTTTTRDTAVYDIYVGLRMQGFSAIGAMRAMRAVGLTLLEAKRAADLHAAKTAWERAA